MHDMRIALDSGYEMKLSGDRKVRITEEVGRGAGCIVYDAVYWDRIHVKHKIRVKECYPNDIKLCRKGDGKLLQVSSGNPVKFEEAKERFTDAYKRNTDIRNTLGLTNSTVNAVDVVSCNNTVYILMPMDEGTDYRNYEDQSLKELLGHMKSLAQIIRNYHENGYLHLDIKPENVLILPETKEHIILFDFDSVTTLEELPQRAGLPYSDGFSAPEQVQGNIRKIGFHSDIYSIGAMLFFKLFDRKPGEDDCKIASTYSFEKMRYSSEKYQPKLYRKLELFFRKTLSVSTAPRWHEMRNVIEALEELIKLADIDEVYLLDSFQYNSACFVGRGADLEEIDKILSRNQLVFLSGIGGIGKTELARQYAYRHRNQYDTISFAVYEKNIETLVDEEIEINQISREKEESEHDYFIRKIEILKQIATPQNLIIIDNFDVEEDENLELLFSCPCKFIITTRKDFRDYNYEQINVDRIEDSREILNLFTTYNTIAYTEKENEAVKQLVEYVEHHTMTVELIAKYLRNTEISPEALYQKFLEKEGVANTEEIRIRQRKDRRLRAESVNSHLKLLFDVSGFDVTERELMASLSLFDGIRISRLQFETMCGIKEMGEKLDLLIQNGWVIFDEHTRKISLHQVIQDLIYHELSPDAENCMHIVVGMNEYLSTEPESYSERDIRKKTAAIFIERLSGNNIPYARLCLKAGNEKKLAEAEKICLKQDNAQAYDLLQRIERKRIKLANDSIVVDWSDEEIPENALCEFGKICKLLEKVTLYCMQSSEGSDYIVREYVDAGSEVAEMLDEQVLWSLAKTPVPELDIIYEKISKMFDVAAEQMPRTSYTATEKEKLYGKIRDFYAKDDTLSYRSKFHLDVKKGYQYQEILNQLREENVLDETADVTVEDDDEFFGFYADDMSCSEMAAEYEDKGNYKEAIACYRKTYEENYATCGGLFIADARGYAISCIARVYRKMGDMDSSIKTLEQGYQRTHASDICLELIRSLIEQRQFRKARWYAEKLIQRRKERVLKSADAYDIKYLVAATYLLYTIEEVETEKVRLWKECLTYYKLLGENTIDSDIADFVVEYMERESDFAEEVLSVVERIREDGKESVRKRILWNAIKKYEGEAGFEEYHLNFLMKLAEISMEYHYKNVKEGLEICDQAQKAYNRYGLTDESMQSRIYKARADLMGEQKEFSYEEQKELRKKCNFWLLAEKKIGQKDCSVEEQVEILRDAARQYDYADNEKMQEECLKKAVETAEWGWQNSENGRLWWLYPEKMLELIRVEIRQDKLIAAQQNLAVLYDKTVRHFFEANVLENRSGNCHDIELIAYEFFDTANEEETIRTYLAAMYIGLEKKPDEELLLCREKGIENLCEALENLLERKLKPEEIDTMIWLKEELERLPEETIAGWECVSSILKKIAERYQYRDIEFKH